MLFLVLYLLLLMTALGKYAFVSRMLMSFSVDETLLPFKDIYSVLCALTWRPMPAAARSKLCSSVSAWLGVFARIAVSST